jgi:hypothetical protein
MKSMRDPISGPIEIVMFAFAVVLFLLIAIEPRRVLEFLFPSAAPLRAIVLSSLRVLCIICVLGLSAVLIAHFVRSR